MSGSTPPSVPTSMAALFLLCCWIPPDSLLSHGRQFFATNTVHPVNGYQPAMPTLHAASITNGQFGFWINGNTGPDYMIQTSTNLTSWIPVFTSNLPSLPYFWVDTNSLSYPFFFYRVLLGP